MRQLHGVVGAKRVGIAQAHGVVQQRWRHLDDDIPPVEMLAETVENRGSAPGRERFAFAATRDGACQLDGGDAGDVDDGGGAVAGDAAHPADVSGKIVEVPDKMMSREQSGAEQDRSMDLATLTAAERAGAAALAIQRMMGILHIGRASRVRVSCL